MDDVKNTLREVMEGYTGKALNGYSYLTVSSDDSVLTVVSIGEVRGKKIVDTGLVVRLVNDKIVIERDVNNKLLVDALLQAGMPRDQIVLAYVGEIVEEPVLNRQFDKPKLLAMMRAEYEFALRTLELVPENRIDEPNVQGVWSVKDIYAHLSAWHRRALDWLDSARRGEPPDRPQGNYTTEEIDAINEQIYEQNRERPIGDITAEFRQTFEQLYAETNSLTDGELFRREGIAVHFGHPAWRYIAYNSCLHYPEHIEPVREWLRG